MRRTLTLIMLLIGSMGLAACGYTPEQRAVNGAAIGAGTGALLGAATGGGVGAALAGGALGAATGAVIGANTRPVPPPPPPPGYYPPPPPPGGCARWGYDPAGNPYCVRYYGY
jgi:hypothetical protein